MLQHCRYYKIKISPHNLKMAFTQKLFSLQKIRCLSSIQRGFKVSRIVYNKPAAVIEVDGDVPGLSEKCIINMTSEPVGPGAAKNTDYKNPEYFCYDKNSYYEAEVEMEKYRLPAPSNKKKQ